MIGQSIAHYKVTAKLGAGGMGEVYRATDTKLGRDVALKVLPQEFAQDPQRMARFQREAQVLASLNHPNIAAIHGLEHQDKIQALAMELVEGATLAERIAGSALPLDEALPIARQIAEALEYAHERGIIHRDLKPANIKLTLDGKVKILDFGLAKALADDAAPQDISSSPTLSMAATKMGMILGTAAYMSPEQAKGRNVDRRTDIWAFGCVLYEMLTGKRAFVGEDVSETLAAIIRGEPDWSALPAATPSRLRMLLQRCMQKDARRRLQAVGDARVEIEEYLANPEVAAAVTSAELPAVPQAKSWRAALPWAVAVILTLALAHAYWKLSSSRSSESSHMRLAIPIQPAKSLGTYGSVLAASPTADLIAFSAGEPAYLYVRGLADDQARQLNGTAGAHSPFFSPDGQWVGFFTPNGQMKKVAVAGGSPVTITDAGDGRGGTWASDGTIIFTPLMNSGLHRVSQDGGKAESLSQPDRSKGERSHRWPRFLPGGKAVAFTIEKGATFDDSAIGVLRLDTREVRTILEGGYDARYSAGHLLYCRSGQLFAVPFDLSSLTVTGPPTPLPSRWVDFGGFGNGNYDITHDGMLLHLPTAKDQEVTSELVWLDPSGRKTPATQKRRVFAEVVLAPNRRFAAVVVAAADNDIWLLDVERDSLTRLTTQGENGWSVWSPDSKRIAYNSTRGDGNMIMWMAVDGSGVEPLLTSKDASVFPTSWSSDGRWLTYVLTNAQTGADIWLLPIENGKAGQPRVFLNQSFNEHYAQISPDGRWLAYVSDESGRNEVYIQSFPTPGTKHQISTDGGTLPRWAGPNRVYFYNDEKILSATLSSRPDFKVSRLSDVATGLTLPGASTSSTPYDVTSDGRIMIIRADRDSLPRHINVELNWLDELRRSTEAQKK